jgi:hypothetical protein
MIFLIVDTNTWLYLANSKNPDTGNFEDGHHIKLLDSLIKKIDSGEVELLLCPIIETEWKRNRSIAEELIKKYQNESKSYKDVIDKIGKSLNEPDRNSLSDLYDKYLATLTSKIKDNNLHIERIEVLIQKATKYEISKETKAFAADWAVEKKAPFVGDKKNSMADAYIFFGAVEYLKKFSKSDLPWEEDLTYDLPTSIFVSGNKGDFSSKNNANNIHEDLKPVADEANLSFFRSLPVALNFIQESSVIHSPIFTDDELQAIEREIEDVSDDWYTCDVCSPDRDNEYLNLVHFSDPFEVEVEEEYVDPNQLQIEFPDLLPVIHRGKQKVTIRTGDCTWCSTTHLLCQCGTVTPIDGENREGFKCDGCDLSYNVRKKYDTKGMYYQEIVVDNSNSAL